MSFSLSDIPIIIKCSICEKDITNKNYEYPKDICFNCILNEKEWDAYDSKYQDFSEFLEEDDKEINSYSFCCWRRLKKNKLK